MRHVKLIIAAPLVALAVFSACGTSSAPDSGASPTASGSAVSSAIAPKSSAEAPLDVGKPASLARKTTPRERRLADEKGCEGGDAAMCRRVADRYRGYGHIAGCGLDRKGAKPRRLVTAADSEADIKGFDTWIRRLCDLGNEEACIQGQQNLSSVRITPRTSYACARGGVGDCPLYQWATGMHPEKTKLIDEARRTFITTGNHGKLFVELFRKEKTRGGDTLPKEVADLATRICKTTHECDEVMLMLDENGYTPAALTPLRKVFGDELANACLEGECVCGAAARYLEPDDARVLDLARIGCDDGEPDACLVLGDRYDSGAGVPKDVPKAISFYQAACPTMVADDRRADIISQAACDRLSIKYEEGKDLEQDRDRAFFYSSLACTGEGITFEHAFCVRRAVYHSKYEYRWRENYLITLNEAGKLIFNGPDDEPINGKECERPSVVELCKKTAPVFIPH